MIHGVLTSHQLLLRYEAHLVLHFFVVPVDVSAVQRHPGLCLLIAVHGVDEGGFPGAGAAQQQHHMPGPDVHVDIPQQVFLLEEFGGRPFLQVHGQPVAHPLHGMPGDQLPGHPADILHLPFRLILLSEAPDQRRNKGEQDPQPAPGAPPPVYLQKPAGDPDHVNEPDDRQGKGRNGKKDDQVFRRSKVFAHGQEHRHKAQDAVDPALLLLAGAACKHIVPGAGDRRPPACDPGLIEHPVQTGDQQRFHDNIGRAVAAEENDQENIQHSVLFPPVPISAVSWSL